MNISKDADQNVEVLSYCETKLCLGFSVKVSPQEIDEVSECPVCYESFKSVKVVRFNKCRHMFCLKCMESLESSLE